MYVWRFLSPTNPIVLARVPILLNAPPYVFLCLCLSWGSLIMMDTKNNWMKYCRGKKEKSNIYVKINSWQIRGKNVYL
jgi:hypothetical protein